MYLTVTDICAPDVQLVALKVKFASASFGFRVTAAFFAAVLAAD